MNYPNFNQFFKHVQFEILIGDSQFKDANTRIFDVNDEIGLIGSGLYPDVCSLHDRAREEANKYLKENREPIKIKKLATTVNPFLIFNHILGLY